MAGEGLYLLRIDPKRSALEIFLLDGNLLQALVVGPEAQDIYDHFRTLGDHGIRDSFVYGVLVGLRCGVTPEADDDAVRT